MLICLLIAIDLSPDSYCCVWDQLLFLDSPNWLNYILPKDEMKMFDFGISQTYLWTFVFSQCKNTNGPFRQIKLLPGFCKHVHVHTNPSIIATTMYNSRLMWHFILFRETIFNRLFSVSVSSYLGKFYVRIYYDYGCLDLRFCEEH